MILRSATLGMVLSCLAAAAQVQLDVPLRSTGPTGTRHVQGLGPPISADALVTVEDAVRAPWQWASASATGNTISLGISPAPLAYADGLLVRFQAPSDLEGPLDLDINGLGAAPLVRPDGLPPVRGQVLQGTICEVMYAGGHFTLLNAPERGCPPGSLAVTARTCIDQSSTGNQLFFTGVDLCASRGGKLCSWDEYVAACVLLGAQLNGMFNAWEWVDDTSNHTQTVNQVGRTTCQSQRSVGVPLTALGETRCCYHPR